ncbi:MAG: hypothetical protein MJ244_06425 [Clostridia bacterium]|nr:hypothetical protein [Clostridia bacterium]
MTKIKRIVSLLLIFTMVVSLCSCGKKEQESYEISMKKTDNQIEFEGYATDIINEYILIRSEIAKLIESENLASDKEGLQSKLTLLQDRCDKLELALDNLIITCDIIASETGDANILDNTKLSLDNVAYAAESSQRVKEWAEEIVGAFDKYPQGKQIKGLAAYLKTDMQTAKKQFDLANDILKNEYENDEQFAQDMIDSFQVIQTTTKVQLCICGAALGNPESLAETGAILLNGVDTVIGFYSTGAEIMLGENDNVTLTFNKAKDFIAPISSITGLLTLSGAKTHEALDYIGNSVVDFMYEGKILGGSLHLDRKEENVKLFGIEVLDCKEDKREETIKTKLAEQGINAPLTEDTVKPISEITNEKINSLTPQTKIEEIPSKLEELNEKISSNKNTNENTSANIKEEVKGDTEFKLNVNQMMYENRKQYGNRMYSSFEELIYYAFIYAGGFDVYKYGDGYAFDIKGYEESSNENDTTVTATVPDMKFVGTKFEAQDGKYVSTFNLSSPIQVKYHVDSANPDNVSDHVLTIDSFELKVYSNDKKIKNKTELRTSAKAIGTKVDTTRSTSYTNNTSFTFSSYLNKMTYIK